MKMRYIFRQLLRYAGIYAVLIALFTGLLIFSAALPRTEHLKKSLTRSAKILLQNGDWPEFGGILLDNYADSLILHAGWTFDPAHPVRSALDPSYYYTEEDAGAQ